MNLSELLSGADVKAEAVAKHVDGLAPEARVAECMALGKAAQARLWEVCADPARPIELEFLVPGDAPPLKPFPLEGKNSLPLFTRFRKVFYRTKDGKIGGYNDQSMGWITGPGYYITRATPGDPRGPVVIDYTMLPADKPEGWPAIRPNERGISSLVYGNMLDFLRRVSRDVVIGRAWKHGKETPNYFVLCRPAAAATTA